MQLALLHLLMLAAVVMIMFGGTSITPRKPPDHPLPVTSPVETSGAPKARKKKPGQPWNSGVWSPGETPISKSGVWGGGGPPPDDDPPPQPAAGRESAAIVSKIDRKRRQQWVEINPKFTVNIRWMPRILTHHRTGSKHVQYRGPIPRT